MEVSAAAPGVPAVWEARADAEAAPAVWEARVDAEAAPADRAGAVGRGVSEGVKAGKGTTKEIYSIEGFCVSKQEHLLPCHIVCRANSCLIALPDRTGDFLGFC